MNRLVSLALAALGVIGIVLALPARPASAQPAHPLGNFSVNQAIGLDLYPDRVAVTAIVDRAELPTLQERPAVDTTGDGTVNPPELTAYNTRVCNAMAGAVALRVDGHRVQWSVRPAGFAYRPGSAWREHQPGIVRVQGGRRPDPAGHGGSRQRVPGRPDRLAGDHGRGAWGPMCTRRFRCARSPIRCARTWPTCSARRSISVRPGCRSSWAMGRALARPSTRVGAIRRAAGSHSGSGAGALGRRASDPFVALSRASRATLGAAHAARPGHGKTVMAAYIAAAAAACATHSPLARS